MNKREKREVFLERETLPFLYNSRRSDRRSSTSQEAKLLYTARATRGHRFVEFRQLREVGVFSYLVYFRLKSHLKWFQWYEVVSGHLISPENWD